MLKISRLPARHSGSLRVIFFTILFQFFFISCRRDGITPNDGTVSLGTPLYTSLPRGYISLTYDDGPGPGTLDLIKYLHSENICATFFVVGDSDPGGGYMHYPLLDSLICYGQRIGNHNTQPSGPGGTFLSGPDISDQAKSVGY